jgi:selenocysteine lyase/cysteine desulfurase
MTVEQVKKLREAAREFFNATVARPGVVFVRSTTRAARDRVNRASDRLEKILQQTAEGK